ncbi:MAG TPA: GNAT family N-acetyltransferase [Terracidiphilus sp.]|nr:GNAT family N-acetyltransferase [Terracidiphilus sp.]
MRNPPADSDVADETQVLPTDAGEALLDNPIFNALHTGHSSLAMSQGLARRYPAPIGPLAGAPDQSLASYESLRLLAEPGGLIGLFLHDPPMLPTGWSLFRGGILTQMICRKPNLDAAGALADGVILRRLGFTDVPAMMELAKLTEPGPFRERTFELGNFYGIFAGDRLLAMAGQRMRVPGFVEVSAVCTHPDARGRGYAGVVMREVMRDIATEGRTSFLHAFDDNPAVRLYQKLGFTHRRNFHLAVIRNEE